MRELRKGFTLVELSLSIAFISILSITVVLIINNAISTYRRGITLNQINTVGMELVDDMRTAIQNSPSNFSVGAECSSNYSGSDLGTERKLCEEDYAKNFVVIERRKDLYINNNDTPVNVPIFGAFCTGAYSYIWNSGYFYAEDEPIKDVAKASLTYKGGTVNDFRLLKIKDQRRAVCISATNVNRGPTAGLRYNVSDDEISSEFNISAYGDISETPEVLLSETNNSLALYDLSSGVPATNDLGSATYYSVSFILGTVQGGINVMSAGNFCEPPENFDSNFDYCAINKFNFAAQATGG